MCANDVVGQRRSRNGGARNKSGALSNSSSRLRHAQGVKAFGAAYGITAGGHYFQVDGIYYLEQKIGAGIVGSYNIGEINGIEFQRMELSPALTYSPFNVSGFFFLNTFAGLTARYETFNGTSELDVDNQFNMGLFIGGEGEVFLLPQMSIYVFVKEDFFIFKPGQWRNVVGAGLRLNIR